MADKYGIKVTLPGEDAKDATPDECAIHPDYLCPKIKLDQNPAHFGTYTKTFASTPAVGETVLFSIAHGLGYKPMNFCLIKYQEGANWKAMPLPAYQGISLMVYAYATATDFKIAINRQAGGTDPTGQTWIFKYYIFVENGG